MNNCIITKLNGSVVNPNLPEFNVMEVLFHNSMSSINILTGGYSNIKAKVDSEYGHFTVGGNNYQEVDMRTHSQVGFVKNATGSPAKVKFDLSVTQSLYGVIDFNNLIGSYTVVD